MSAAPPVLRVESGDPAAEELAALVAVLTAVLSGVADAGLEPAPAGRRSAWADPSWQLAGAWPAPGGWRASGLPR